MKIKIEDGVEKPTKYPEIAGMKVKQSFWTDDQKYRINVMSYMKSNLGWKVSRREEGKGWRIFRDA